MRFAGLVLALAVSVPVSAHIALWDDAMFGWDPNDPNQSEPVLPLMDLSFNEWWFHGYINKPPAAGKFMILPAGGTYHGQVACNKALTKYGQNAHQQTGVYACDGDGPSGGIGAMHTTDQWGSPDPRDVKGCGLAIAYESDEHKVQPEDFTVISTNYTCPWSKNVEFQIPADLPACPPEGCLCSWGWVHSIDAGSQQNYHLIYRCKVEGATGITPIPPAQTANKCDLPNDTTNCTVGAKQPHYWYQKERNNNPQGQYDPPFYNGGYGYLNGAQTDLFATVGGAEVGTPEPAPAPAISSSASSALPSRQPMPASASVQASIPAQVAAVSSPPVAASGGSVAAPSIHSSASSSATPVASLTVENTAPSSSSDDISSAEIASPTSLAVQGALDSSSLTPVAASSAVSSASTMRVSAAAAASPASSSALNVSFQPDPPNSTQPKKKICKRKRAIKRELIFAQLVGQPHERSLELSARHATPQVIAQRRWEQNRANRGLTKRSLGAGIF